MSLKYTFPFNSCEIPNKNGIAQPYSAFINLLACFTVLYFIYYSNNFYSKLFLFSVLLFNISHTFSHSIHLGHLGQYKNLHFLLTHYTAIISTICLLILLTKISNTFPNTFFIYFLFFLYLLDLIFVVYNFSHIYNIAIFLLILVFLILYYYTFLPNIIKQNIIYIVILSLFAFMFQIFEIYYCKKILDINPKFPLHIVVEICVFFPILLICKCFYKN